MRLSAFILALSMAAIAAGCQSSPTASDGPRNCTPRAEESGYCYGISLPARVGL